MALGSFAFANGLDSDNQTMSNLGAVDYGTCSYSIEHTITYPSGRTFSWTTYHTAEANSLQQCIGIARNHVTSLNEG